MKRRPHDASQAGAHPGPQQQSRHRQANVDQRGDLAVVKVKTERLQTDR